MHVNDYSPVLNELSTEEAKKFADELSALSRKQTLERNPGTEVKAAGQYCKINVFFEPYLGLDFQCTSIHLDPLGFKPEKDQSFRPGPFKSPIR
jgi:hypothetical protein